MAGLNQRQWLNIMIFAISVLFLLSLLLNKKMQSGFSTDTTSAQAQPHAQVQNNNPQNSVGLAQELIMIEFAQTKLIKNNSQWLAVGKPISQNKIKTLPHLWLKILQQKMPTQKQISQRPISETTSLATSSIDKHKNHWVKLYLQQRQQPIEIVLIEKQKKNYLYFKSIDTELLLDAEPAEDYFP